MFHFINKVNIIKVLAPRQVHWGAWTGKFVLCNSSSLLFQILIQLSEYNFFSIHFSHVIIYGKCLALSSTVENRVKRSFTDLSACICPSHYYSVNMLYTRICVVHLHHYAYIYAVNNIHYNFIHMQAPALSVVTPRQGTQINNHHLNC